MYAFFRIFGFCIAIVPTTTVETPFLIQKDICFRVLIPPPNCTFKSVFLMIFIITFLFLDLPFKAPSRSTRCKSVKPFFLN